MLKHYETAKYANTRHDLVSHNPNQTQWKLTIDRTKRYQTMLGFGGAFTEAAAYTLSRMSTDKRRQVLMAYFDPRNGLKYNLGRVSVHSCDFSLNNYTYVDDYDETLASFSIERDKKYVIPMIKDAMKIRGKNIDVVASPWSPPAWMKNNNAMNNGGRLLPQYRQTWADYLVKFVKTYTKAGVPVFAITVQNEPAAVQVWDSCLYTAEEERDFVKYYLGPTFKTSSVAQTKIIIWDHNRDVMVERASTVLKDPDANAYIWGIGVHWYVSEAFENLSVVHKMFPNKHLLFTEGTIEGGVKLQAFESGERYARNMIGDISNYCVGYIDWNLTLDEQGGPNHVGNYCDAPIICDTKKNTVHINYSYDAIGHFSKHVEVGAKRIDSSSDCAALRHVAFENPDGSIVLVMQNETEHDYSIQLSLKDNHYNVIVRKRSISTITFEVTL